MTSKIKVLDGGFSTQLSKYVGQMDGDPLWTARFVATNPEAIVKSHLDFLRAGSDIIETCTYQASIPEYMKYLNISEDEARGFIRKAAELAFKARDLHLQDCPDAVIEIVGSIGPHGALLHDGSEYTGNYAYTVSAEEMKNTQRPRVQELIKAGIKMFAFETIPASKEALAMAELLKEFPDIKAWISFTCKNGKNLSNGDNFKESALQCYNANPEQIVAVGINCSNPLYVHDLVKDVNDGRAEDNLIPLIVYPNSGEKYTIEIGWSGEKTVDSLHTFVDDWINLGACYIGGCCRTHADDIALIKQEVQKWNDV